MKQALALALLLAAAPALLHAAETLEQTVVTTDLFESTSGDTETVAFYTGHVVVTATNLKMTCDRMKTITAKVADKSDTIGQPSQFKYMLATGHVHIWQGEREATCGRAEVLPGEDKIVLTESPSVTDHGNNSVGTGDIIEIHRNQRVVTGKNVRFVLPPIKDLGFDKNQPPAATPQSPAQEPAATPAIAPPPPAAPSK
jgi:lipopolysaccharide export system protein LptA